MNDPADRPAEPGSPESPSPSPASAEGAAGTSADASAEPPEPKRDPRLDEPYRAPAHSDPGHGHGPTGNPTRVALAALGVVFGDIGTSPLYTIKECFSSEHGVAPSAENVSGVTALIFWSLILVIVVKYITFIMRADNRGEGGILALLSLVMSKGPSAFSSVLITLGLFGAALLYGDGIITPAISVLSAVEGLSVATSFFNPYIIPITAVVLVVLFLAQRRGTAGIGAVFGPTMLVWFVGISLIAMPAIARHPSVVLGALNPVSAVSFFWRNGTDGFFVLSSVVLCITGGEALYADMGHFGRGPIARAWYVVVLPALLLNYLGQGAFLLDRCADVGSTACTAARANPFFGLTPGVLVYPMVIVATVAAVVASQALISGAFSLTQQAVQLGYCPRVTIVHTSGEAAGQIFIPEINNALMVSCVALVVAFKASTNLAAAYGIAVTGTMAITSLLFFAVARRKWNWPLWKAASITGLFLLIDLTYFAANLDKLTQGGWFPIAVAVGVFTLMTTWKHGRAALARYVLAATLPLDLFFLDVKESKPPRVRGTAVFMTPNPDGTPPVLLHHFKHNKVLHEQVVLLSIKTETHPQVHARDRVEVKELEQGFWLITAHYGFMQTPNARDVLKSAAEKGLRTNEADTSFYLGRETLLTTGRSDMARWRKALFAYLSRNAKPAWTFFGLPPNRVVELGMQIEL